MNTHVNCSLLFFIATVMPSFSVAPRESETSGALVRGLRCEFLPSPARVSNPLPRFGWMIESDTRGLMQADYQILVAASEETLAKDEGDLWDSGPTSGRRTQFVEYGGAPLQDGREIHWKVRVRDRTGKWSQWSDQAVAAVELSAPVVPGSISLSPRGEEISRFTCNDPVLNEIHQIAMKRASEIHSARDLGLAMPMMAYHTRFLPEVREWLDGFHRSVNSAGFYPSNSPADGSYGSTSSDAAVSATYAYWRATDDRELISRYWPTMYSYLLKRKQLDPSFEGVAFGKLPDDTFPEGDSTPEWYGHFVSQAINLRLMIELARVGSQNPYEMKVLLSYREELQRKFREKCIEPDGSIKYRSLTAVLMGLRSGLLETVQERQANEKVLLDALDGLEGSPFAVSPFAAAHLLPVLVWCGHGERAIALARSQNPEELSPLASVSIAGWLVSFVAGIDCLESGYSEFLIHPLIEGEGPIHTAEAAFSSPTGRIRSNWAKTGNTLHFELAVPPNSTALVQLPISKSQQILEGGQSIKGRKFIFSIKEEDDRLEFRVAPGTYSFVVDKPSGQ